MGEAALQLVQPAEQQQGFVPRQEAEVLSVRALASERWTQARFSRWLGSLTTEQVIEKPPLPDPEVTLIDAIERALQGDEEASQLVSINVGSAVSEACFKDRHFTRIRMQRNEAGQPIQFGQTLPQIHRNSLVLRPDRHSVLQEITKAEALNGHRIEDSARSGQLKDYWLVVPSLVPDNVPEKDLGPEGDGYFLSSMTFALQATTEQDGEIITESAFNAGVEPDEHMHFEERQAQRYDIAAFDALYKRLGLEPRASVTDYIREPILISKELMPNGVVDVLRWFDEEADRIRGNSVKRTEVQYQQLIQTSTERERSLQATKARVKQDLLARAGTFTDPMEAVQLLWDLAKQYTVEASLKNVHINPRVFGDAAAAPIIEARRLAQMGDMRQAQQLMQRAQKVAVVSGCGGGSAAASDKANTSNAQNPEEFGKEQGENKEAGGDCEYEIDSCYCSNYNTNGTRRKRPLTVKVYKDTHNVAHCRRCGAWLAADGKGKYEGLIKKRADRQARGTGVLALAA